MHFVMSCMAMVNLGWGQDRQDVYFFSKAVCLRGMFYWFAINKRAISDFVFPKGVKFSSCSIPLKRVRTSRSSDQSTNFVNVQDNSTDEWEIGGRLSWFVLGVSAPSHRKWKKKLMADCLRVLVHRLGAQRERIDCPLS